MKIKWKSPEAAVVAVAATGVLLTELVAGPVPPKTFCPNGDAAVDAAPLTLPNKLGPPEPVDDWPNSEGLAPTAAAVPPNSEGLAPAAAAVPPNSDLGCWKINLKITIKNSIPI